MNTVVFMRKNMPWYENDGWRVNEVDQAVKFTNDGILLYAVLCFMKNGIDIYDRSISDLFAFMKKDKVRDKEVKWFVHTFQELALRGHELKDQYTVCGVVPEEVKPGQKIYIVFQQREGRYEKGDNFFTVPGEDFRKLVQTAESFSAFKGLFNVYMYMRTKAKLTTTSTEGRCAFSFYKSADKMAEELEMSHTTLSKYINALVELRLIAYLPGEGRIMNTYVYPAVEWAVESVLNRKKTRRYVTKMSHRIHEFV